MVLTVALLVVILSLGAVYVLAPLFRDEDELGGFERALPNGRSPHGTNPEETSEPRKVPLDADIVQCPNCGAVVETAYSYCGECLAKVR